MEALLAVAVRVDDLLGAVFLGDVGEGALLLEDVRRRIVQEQDELLEARSHRRIERAA